MKTKPAVETLQKGDSYNIFYKVTGEHTPLKLLKLKYNDKYQYHFEQSYRRGVRYSVEKGYPKGRTHNIDLIDNVIMYESNNSKWYSYEFDNSDIAKKVWENITGLKFIPAEKKEVHSTKRVKIISSPVTERYVKLGDIGRVQNDSILINGVYFKFDERWKVEELSDNN